MISKSSESQAKEKVKLPTQHTLSNKTVSVNPECREYEYAEFKIRRQILEIVLQEFFNRE